MKRAYKYGPFVVLGIFIVIILSYVNSLDVGSQVLLAPAQSEVAFPISCDDADISDFWDRVFVESSDGITIVADDEFSNGWDWELCTSFSAYKILGSQVYFLEGHLNPKYSYRAIKAGVTQGFIDSFNSQGALVFEGNQGVFKVASSNLLDRSAELTTVPQATTEHENVFKIYPEGSFEFVSGSYADNSYISEGEKDVSGINIYVKSVVGSIKDYSYLSFEDESTCDPDFVEIEDVCIDNETIFTYEDLNSCGSVLFAPQERTEICDASGDGSFNIVGNIAGFSEAHPTFIILINGTLIDPFETFSSEIRRFEVIDSGKPLLAFDYNFGEKGDLNVDGIEIVQNGVADTFGFTIINGLNVEKTIRVDRVANGNAVCIKDAEVISISEISEGCTGPDEILVACPGVSDNYECLISQEGYFVVYGLMNSGVKEFGTSGTQQDQQGDLTSGNCIPNWECAEWGDCVDGNKTRICTDLNSCGTPTKPIDVQGCTKDDSKYLPIMISSLVILFLLIILIIAFLVVKRNNESFQQSTQVVMKARRTQTPTFTPSNSRSKI